jgi:hypothetical protein
VKALHLLKATARLVGSQQLAGGKPLAKVCDALLRPESHSVSCNPLRPAVSTEEGCLNWPNSDCCFSLLHMQTPKAQLWTVKRRSCRGHEEASKGRGKAKIHMSYLVY